jgi:hypothetical protein
VIGESAEVPGPGVDSAQQIIAEVGATAATFPAPKHLASWMGACPGNEESAGVNYSHRCPKGNRQMRRVLNQAANAPVKAKGTIFAVVYRLGYRVELLPAPSSSPAMIGRDFRLAGHRCLKAALIKVASTRRLGRVRDALWNWLLSAA